MQVSRNPVATQSSGGDFDIDFDFFA